MKITRLLGNRILLEPLASETVTAGGIAIPERQVQKQPVGFVRMVGTGNGDATLAADMAEMKVGQKVRVNTRMGGVEVSLEGVPHRIHSVMDVECIFEPEVIVGVDHAIPGTDKTVYA